MCLKSVSVVDSLGTAESSILGKSLCIIDKIPLEKKIFEGFLPYMDVAAIFVM